MTSPIKTKSFSVQRSVNAHRSRSPSSLNNSSKFGYSSGHQFEVFYSYPLLCFRLLLINIPDVLCIRPVVTLMIFAPPLHFSPSANKKAFNSSGGRS